MMKHQQIKRIGITKLFAICLVLVFSFSISQYSLYSDTQANNKYPLLESGPIKNVIFLIGDGMGIVQISSSRIKALGANGLLNMEKMPIVGFIKTHSANELVTDSAASGTAMATGFKTNNGMISTSPGGKKLVTILEKFENIGKSTGLVATSRITHATPASFGAHVKSRNQEAKIATHLLNNDIEVLLGGGEDLFIPHSQKNSKRKDSLNLLQSAKKSGYTFAATRDELMKAKGEKILGLFNLAALEFDGKEPSLADMTKKAIDTLKKNPKGFFLMVEGSQIDWECHKNKADRAIQRVIEFDKAVKVALDYALSNKETLVIVTGDHETGGMTLNDGELSGEKLKIKWTSMSHTGVSLPIFAFGPHAIRFAGVYDNTNIPKIIADLFGIKDFPKMLD
jgi:alkaline phosphatase